MLDIVISNKCKKDLRRAKKAASLSASTLVIFSTLVRVVDSKRLGVTMVARGRILERSEIGRAHV